jgi:hypothetical protein
MVRAPPANCRFSTVSAHKFSGFLSTTDTAEYSVLCRTRAPARISLFLVDSYVRIEVEADPVTASVTSMVRVEVALEHTVLHSR